jgi:hypothetical protein
MPVGCQCGNWALVNLLITISVYCKIGILFKVSCIFYNLRHKSHHETQHNTRHNTTQHNAALNIICCWQHKTGFGANAPKASSRKNVVWTLLAGDPRFAYKQKLYVRYLMQKKLVAGTPNMLPEFFLGFLILFRQIPRRYLKLGHDLFHLPSFSSHYSLIIRSFDAV